MSDIRETLTNFTKNVTKSSGDLFKSTKLSMSVTAEQNNLKNLYLEIGKKVHEIYQYGGNLGKFFDEKYREIEACEIKIAEIKEQISLIKGTRECTKCGKSAERTAEFCPKCGIRLAAPSDQPGAPTPMQMEDFNPSINFDADIIMPQTSAPIEVAASHPPGTIPHPSAVSHPAGTIPHPSSLAATPPEPEAVASTRHCRVCGMENDITTKFCLSCGRIVD